jgi:predicted transcriptional regulator of viral defense system
VRQEAKIMFASRMDILIYAAHLKRTFTVRDVFNDVIDAHRMTIRNCLRDLIECGYLEKVSIYDFQATHKAKELFGVNK